MLAQCGRSARMPQTHKVISKITSACRGNKICPRIISELFPTTLIPMGLLSFIL